MLGYGNVEPLRQILCQEDNLTLLPAQLQVTMAYVLRLENQLKYSVLGPSPTPTGATPTPTTAIERGKWRKRLRSSYIRSRNLKAYHYARTEE